MLATYWYAKFKLRYFEPKKFALPLYKEMYKAFAKSVPPAPSAPRY